ncbi:MAG: sugar ABC transporter ATP-binding protein, partial [Eubacteriales bacterium]|nr:sugar ABC transporter ATP-binding protein [Eubacteriales bacterium]
MGLVPVNSTGLNTLMKLLVNNLPLHYGYVYYRERLVNNWLEPATTTNRISIIGSRNVLVDDLSVADNVFVLRPGFRKYVMSRKVLGMQLQPFLHEIGVEIAADACVRDLSPFQQFVVALVRAVVAGNRLVVLRDVSNFLSDTELKKLHEILRHYAKEGMSFLYICLHSEEVQQLCTRTAYMINGQV